MNAVRGYTAAVVAQLEGLPKADRQRLAAELEADLADHPEAEDLSALETRFGKPVEYAAALAAELGVRPGRRRRPRGWGWVTVAAAIGVSAWLGVALGPQPLEQGSSSGLVDVGYSDAAAPFEGRELTWDPTTEGVLFGSVRNAGPIPVTIVDIDVFTDVDDGDRVSLVRQSSVTVEGGEFAGYGVFDDPTDLESQPVAVASNEETNFGVNIRFADCEHLGAGTITGWDTARITYGMLGIRRSTEVPIPYVFVQSPSVCEAPTNRTHANAAAARAAGLPDWIPDDVTEIRVASGDEGTVAVMTSQATVECGHAGEFAPAAYRPTWLPRLDELMQDDVARCDDGWLLWSPEPESLVIWTDFATPVSG